eukprot:377289-Rhodomonas_salina.1
MPCLQLCPFYLRASAGVGQSSNVLCLHGDQANADSCMEQTVQMRSRIALGPATVCCSLSTSFLTACFPCKCLNLAASAPITPGQGLPLQGRNGESPE